MDGTNGNAVNRADLEIINDLLEQAGIPTTEQALQHLLDSAVPVEALPVPWELLSDDVVDAMAKRLEELRARYGEPGKGK